MSPTLRTVLAIFCVGVISITAILIVEKLVGRTRVDLTEYQLYSLSEGTRNILSDLSKPVEMKLFYSRIGAMKGPEQIRFWNNYYLYVRDILEEYVALSGGKLELEVIDPRPFSDEAEDAIDYGLERRHIWEDEFFYFGLVAKSELGKTEVIEFFRPDRLEFVEYDISKLISRMTTREKDSIGVISSMEIAGMELPENIRQMLRAQGRNPREPWMLIRELRQEYEVTALPSDIEEIGEEIDFLMVVHPKDLPEQTLYAIDQYVMGGGKLLVFVDPFCFSDQPQQDQRYYAPQMPHKQSSDLNDLLEKWGVTLETKEIVVDRELALNPPAFSGAILPYLELGEDNVNPDEVISAKLHSIQVFYAGGLHEQEDSEATVTPLLFTTPEGATWEPGNMEEIRNKNPQDIADEVGEGEEKFILACLINGDLETNFPDGPPGGLDLLAEEEGEEDAEEPDVVTEAEEGASVVVVSDVDMISDGLAYFRYGNAVYQNGHNVSFVLNALEFLGGSPDLISIRSRGNYKRPFKRLDKIEEEVEEEMESREKDIEENIAELEEEKEKLGVATIGNLVLIDSEDVEAYQASEEAIREAEEKKRKLKARKREKIEELGATVKTLNMVVAPVVVLLIAISLAVVRFVKAKLYVTRREE